MDTNTSKGEQLELGLNNVWRVQIIGEDKFRINDFTLPRNDVIVNKVYSRNTLPKWVSDALSVLQITDDYSTIKAIGKRVDENIFYVVEPIKE